MFVSITTSLLWSWPHPYGEAILGDLSNFESRLIHRSKSITPTFSFWTCDQTMAWLIDLFAKSLWKRERSSNSNSISHAWERVFEDVRRGGSPYLVKKRVGAHRSAVGQRSGFSHLMSSSTNTPLKVARLELLRLEVELWSSRVGFPIDIVRPLCPDGERHE